MSLDDLNKELYNSQESNVAGHEHEQSSYDPFNVASRSTSSPFNQQQQWDREEKEREQARQKKKLRIGISIFGGIIALIMIISGYNWWTKNAFHQDRVAISFEGPKETDSTQSAKYLIHYKNNNRVTLKDAKIQLSYSENFQPTDNVNLKYLSPTTSYFTLGDIKSMSEGTVELNGNFYAPKDFPVYLHAALNYTPSNGSTQYTMEGQIGVNVTASPVQLNISAPQQATSGNKVFYIVDYKNLDTKQMSGIQIKIVFPAGFTFSSSQPAPSEGEATWYVGNLDPGQSGKIMITGKLSGETGESKDIAVSFGKASDNGNFVVYSKQEFSTHIVQPVLQVSQSLQDNKDNVIEPGEVLKFVINFQNTGTMGLRDAIVKAKVVGKILDFSQINVENGSYDGTNGTITWKASDVPALAIVDPKASGQVRFSIPVKSVIPVESQNDKNFIVTSMASVDSPDIQAPESSNKVVDTDQMELKLSSKVLFDTHGYFNDSVIKNSGPIPLQTGQETTFTIHWSVVNVSNDIINTRVTGSLPAGARWTGKIYPSDAKITFNSRTNQIIWDAGMIPAGTGVLGAAKDVAFQVGVTPQINQVGSFLKLINKSTFTATDPFVSKDISLDGQEKTTQLSEDSAVGFNNGKVLK